MKKKTWANVVLASSAVLTAAAAPYKDISLLAEGLFHLGFAATVGGFADWFGVASLFGKPLGIGKRTDIIAKDRDKIIRLAREMITEELLTRQRIKALVVKNVPTDVLYKWILSHEAGVKNVLDAAALLSLNSIDREALWRFLSAKAAESAASTDWAGQIALVLEEFRAGEKSRPLIDVLAREAKAFLEDECTQDEIRKIYLSAWKDYEQNGFLRGLLRSSVQDQTEEVTTLIRKELLKLADSLTEKGSPARLFIDEKCASLIRALEDDKDVKKKVNHFVTEKAAVLLAGKGKETAFRLWEENRPLAAEHLSAIVLSMIKTGFADEKKRRAFDAFLVRLFLPLLPKIHESIGNAVTEKLSSMDGRTMAGLAKDAVSEDTAAIRLNGSLFGAILGLLFFLVPMIGGGL
ncbi:MAG TPA: DUF445 domain-containing protein [Veillonellaceae bacterium]|nr:DUF445 domain-containing protein [Veillonellaceae bacterium]